MLPPTLCLLPTIPEAAAAALQSLLAELLRVVEADASDRGDDRVANARGVEAPPQPDFDDGRDVQVRFVWTRQGADAAHWAQAFSLDGREWETNWTMALTRSD